MSKTPGKDGIEIAPEELAAVMALAIAMLPDCGGDLGAAFASAVARYVGRVRLPAATGGLPVHESHIRAGSGCVTFADGRYRLVLTREH